MWENEIPENQYPKWRFIIYIVGDSPRSFRALNNLERICKETLISDYDIDVVDISKDPQRASEDQILAAPTVIKKYPKPERRVVGDLSDPAAVIKGLEI